MARFTQNPKPTDYIRFTARTVLEPDVLLERVFITNDGRESFSITVRQVLDARGHPYIRIKMDNPATKNAIEGPAALMLAR